MEGGGGASTFYQEHRNARVGLATGNREEGLAGITWSEKRNTGKKRGVRGGIGSVTRGSLVLSPEKSGTIKRRRRGREQCPQLPPKKAYPACLPSRDKKKKWPLFAMGEGKKK